MNRLRIQFWEWKLSTGWLLLFGLRWRRYPKALQLFIYPLPMVELEIYVQWH